MIIHLLREKELISFFPFFATGLIINGSNASESDHRQFQAHFFFHFFVIFLLRDVDSAKKQQ